MKLRLLKYPQFWWDTWYSVKCFFKPKQEWLHDVIPDTYCDKVELIPQLLFKCLEHYVEVELKSDHVADLEYDWEYDVKKGHISQEYADNQIKRQKDILKAYKWIKTGRGELEKQINDAYPETDWRKEVDDVFIKSEEHEGFYEMKISDERKACYKEVTRLESLKVKKDTEAMRIIVKHHQTLWT